MYDFMVFGCDGDCEFVLGLVGCFWEVVGGLVCVEVGVFCVFLEFNIVKLVMMFVVEFDGVGMLLIMCICVYCLDIMVCCCFMFYWVLICILSGLICWMML